MDALLKQLRELPERLRGMPAAQRRLLIAGVAVLVLVAVGASLLHVTGDDWRYAYSNLSSEDGQAAAATLRTAGIPHRLEGGGAAVAVPADRVYDARLVLASAGIPGESGVGFELFDRSDIGISSFTQNVNLRRAIEGELSRTIRSLEAVQDARVHVTLARKGLYQDEDQQAAASVVLKLADGMALDERRLAGIRNLVAAAVPGLDPKNVTIVDGTGTVLGSGEPGGPLALGEYQRSIERRMERRILALLEPVVGEGGVIAKVTASVDGREVESTSHVFDPDKTAVRSERSLLQTQTGGSERPGGIAGAAANAPDGEAARSTRAGSGGASTSEDETRNYEVSNTVTTTVTRAPRLERLTVAVVVDGVDGEPRPAAEVARLSELVKRAVGYDAGRGDEVEMSSIAFSRLPDGQTAAEPAEPEQPMLPIAAAAGGALLLLGLFLLTRRRRDASAQGVLRPGVRVADAEAALDGVEVEALGPANPADVLAERRERARALIAANPERAARLLRAWLADDHLEQETTS